MKSFFIYNPIAGSGNKTEIFYEKINELKNKYAEIEVIETKNVGDATIITKRLIEEHENETINIFACGGDGTSCEVVNGLATARNVNFGIVPTGSCNDFLKNFENYDFMNLENQLNGEIKTIDCLKVNDYYCLNVCNIGFDAKVNYDQIQLRQKYHNVKKAYNKAIIKNLLKKLGDEVRIIVDKKEVFNGKSLLMVFGNGEHYGGSFQPFKNTSLNDGICDMMVVKKVGIIRFASLLGRYKVGEVYNNPKIKVVKSFVGKDIEINSPNILTVCIDGETIFTKHIHINIIPKTINFIIPKTL